MRLPRFADSHDTATELRPQPTQDVGDDVGSHTELLSDFDGSSDGTGLADSSAAIIDRYASCGDATLSCHRERVTWILSVAVGVEATLIVPLRAFERQSGWF